jgi:hypothetical protein
MFLGGGQHMTIYRLEPIEGTEQHPYWRMSIVPPVPVWVQASTPDLARQRMQSAARETPLNAKRDEVRTPWVDASLVSCTEDRSHYVPAGRAIFANDKITLRLP